MIIEQIDNRKVLIVLGGKEMDDFSLNYNTLSFEDPHSNKILKRLLHLACDKTEISIKNKKILVEAIPQDRGCIILLTLLDNINRKIYKIKKRKTDVCLIFNSTENMISACVALHKTKQPQNCLYYYDNKYAILFYNIYEDKKLFALLREFSDKFIVGKIQSARLREKGKLLLKNNAINTIASYFNISSN